MGSYTIETLGRLKPHLYQEWLLTNGLGGFAASSIVGCNTRVYHGLLVAATLPPVGRIMTMNRMREVVVLDGQYDQPYEFSANQFRHRFYPEGWNHLRRFEIESEQCARWHYEIDGVRIVKEVQLPWRKNAVGIRYTIDGPADRKVELQLLPFVSLRDFHGTRHANDVTFNVHGHSDRRIEIAGGAVPLHIESDAGHFTHEAGWWYEHVYAIEQRRGLADAEDLFTPGRFTLNTAHDAARRITLWAALSDPVVHDWDEELGARRDAINEACSLRENLEAPGDPTGRETLPLPPECDPDVSPTVRKLAQAANDFIVKRRNPDGRDGTSVIAGYPWFADWGRDTFISLPGLLLTTRRFAQARQALTVFGKHVSEGMIPNRFDDYTNEPHYNTVDASLWYIHAAFEYLRLTKDEATFEAELRPACRKIIDGYKRGTRFGIRMDDDALITQGDEHTQLTWMDAKYQDTCFTPRQGKPVEINALWYHALRLMGEDELARRVSDSFIKAFWINPFRGCADVVKMDGEQDRALRPNQIFAVSLPNSPLKPEQQLAVVEVVRRELLTPYGLRTLSRDDPNYHARYIGPRPERDSVYHNGIVWPWLIGAFLDAHLRVNHHADEAVEQAKKWLAPLIEFLDAGMCVGQLPEIFEAETPQEPVGCFAQAWSIAEVLRLSVALGL